MTSSARSKAATTSEEEPEQTVAAPPSVFDPTKSRQAQFSTYADDAGSIVAGGLGGPPPVHGKQVIQTLGTPA